MQIFWRIAVCLIIAAGLPGEILAVEGPQWIETEPGFEVEMQPQMLRRRYGAVVTRQEIVAQELENSVSVADEVEFIRWRQSQRPNLAGSVQAFGDRAFGEQGSGVRDSGLPDFGGRNGAARFAPMMAPGIAPWGPNTMTQPTGELYW